MSFLVYGRNGRTGEIVRRVDYDSHSKDGARRAAEVLGIRVTVVVANPKREVPADDPAKSLNPKYKPAQERVLASETVTFRRELCEVTPQTPVTYALVATDLAVFVLMAVAGVSIGNPKVADLLRWGADFGPLALGGEPWRLFTSIFVHIGLKHVVSNMLVFLYVGPMVERMFGSSGFLALYLIAGLAGSFWALYWNPLGVEAGASGAIFGIYGALAAVLLRERASIPPHVGARLLRIAAIFVFYNLINSLRPSISMAAHIGGLVAGFALGFAMAQPIAPAAAEGRPLRGMAALGAGTLFFVAGLVGVHARYPNLNRLAEALDGFTVVESTIPKLIDSMQLKADAHAASAAQAANQIEHELLPTWREAETTIASLTPIPASMANDVAAIVQYMQQREANWQALASAWREGDSVRIDAAEKEMHAIDLRAWEIGRSPLLGPQRR